MRVSRVLYSLTVNSEPTFPAHDPENMDAIIDALLALPAAPQLYTAPDAVSLDQHWTLTLRGPVSKAMHVEVAAALKLAYAFLGDMALGLEFVIAGWDMHVDETSE